ncbi:hypothetical protein FQN57_007379 [Myotisia sp. PD_48]|nr:hypothetical protein FQN57_007379 [Myotisia sp. PD_48]
MAPWDPPSPAVKLLASPLVFFLQPVYRLLSALRAPPNTHASSQCPVRVVCISDTHTNRLSSVPEGDILIHAGDLTNAGTLDELQDAIDWLNTLPHKHKVVVAGNHDGWLDVQVRDKVVQTALPTEGEEEDEEEEQSLDWGDVHYLQNSSVMLSVSNATTSRTLMVHGIPQIPQLEAHQTIHAFQYPPTVKSPWPNTVPPETDILVSHSPPKYHADIFPNCLGCPHLLNAVWQVKPALHVFGHVHAGRGVERVYYDGAQRAWERLLRRREEGGNLWERGNRSYFWWVFCRASIFRDMISVFGAWRDVSIVLWSSMKAVLWTRVWGGRGALGLEGWMVNPACMDSKGKSLVGNGTVIDI